MTEDLGLYLHIPFCKSRCSYCSFYSIGMKADDKFVKAFEKEIELKSCKYKNKICDTIYFGGGTPSTLSS
ncbi:MAG: coproporphyrinogen III oxidase, partial [Dialister micraerophilus]|nr:coproporphyrinogen III oxidase [Dialister micraerophilus]